MAGLDTSRAMSVVSIIIGAVVVLSVVAAVAPNFFTELATTNGVLTDANTTTGSDDADALLSVFPLLVGIAGLFAIVGVILAAVRLRSD